MLENVQVQEDNTGLDGTFGLVVMLGGGPVQHLSTYTRAERDSWRGAIESASHGKMKQVLQRLRERVSQLTDSQTDNREDEPTLETVIDPSCPPLLECSFSCDNLLCDALGRSPSARLLVYIRNSTNGEWRMYSNTEIVEVRSTEASESCKKCFITENQQSFFPANCHIQIPTQHFQRDSSES